MNGDALLADFIRKTGNTSLLITDALPYFNNALDEISKFREELAYAKTPQKVTSAKDEYTMPGNYLPGTMQKVIYTSDGEEDGFLLKCKDFAQVIYSKARGIPEEYYINDSRMGFVPKVMDPGGYVEMWYFKRLPWLVDGNSVPELPAVDHELITIIATKAYLMGLQDFDEADKWSVEALKRTSLLGDEKVRPDRFILVK